MNVGVDSLAGLRNDMLSIINIQTRPFSTGNSSSLAIKHKGTPFNATRRRFPCGLVASFLLLTCCQRHFDPEMARKEILKLHQGFIEAHLAEDPSILVATISDNYLFVSDGDVLTLNADDVEEMLTHYFDTTTFSRYADTDDPVIGFSKDGTLAWSIVQVRVSGARHYESSPDDRFDTQWAWITLYEKRGARWSRLADVSTSRPFEQSK